MKGVVYYNQKDNVSGLYGGERDLGNAPEFSFNIAIEKLEHFSSRGGLKAKDKEIVSQITPNIKFTLDEVSKENLALLTLADLVAVTQIAGSVSAEVVIAHLDRRSDLSKRNIGSFIIFHGAVTGGPFVVGTTVLSDNVDPGAGTIIAVGTGQLGVLIESGTFAAADELSVGVITATQSGVPVFNPGIILVENAAQTTTYTVGTDYVVSTLLKDNIIGRVLILESGTILEADSLRVSFNHQAASYTEVRAFKQTVIEGILRFVSDNPVGTQQELQIWRCTLAPDGDTAMIGDEWSTLGFTGEVLKDEVGHPDSPYMNILLV